MKSLFLVFVVLLTVTMASRPAAALTVDHDSAYANANGTSRFSDPDDQLSGNQFGSVQLGNSSSSDSDTGNSVTFGMFMGNNSGQANAPMPGFAMQGCMAPSCQH